MQKTVLGCATFSKNLFKKKMLKVGKPTASSLDRDFHDEEDVPEIRKEALEAIQVFKDCNICVIGPLSERKGWFKRKVVKLGGRFSPIMTEKVTHLIAPATVNCLFSLV
jgi:hypothetical protein